MRIAQHRDLRSVARSLLANDGSVNPAPGLTGAGAMQRDSSAPAYRNLYGFKGHPSGDGKWPNGSLVAVDGVIYGVTMTAGIHEHGVVFLLIPPATSASSMHLPATRTACSRTALHSERYALRHDVRWRDAPQGDGLRVDPIGHRTRPSQLRRRPRRASSVGVVLGWRRLYGVTQLGGANGRGTVFEISTRGSQHIARASRAAPTVANPRDGSSTRPAALGDRPGWRHRMPTASVAERSSA